jgi:pimeloyl-ACP methyl ester carboxylesterase
MEVAPMSLKTSLSAVICLLIVLVACDGSDYRIKKTNPYAANELWTCKPGITPDACLDLDQTTTFIYSSTSQAIVEHIPAVEPEFDCFYLYPTIDLSEEPGNTEDIPATIAENEFSFFRAVYNHAARFTSLCNMYIPLYHQMTVGTLNLEGGYRNTDYYDIAFNDVNDAFEQYLSESGDRPFVLMGHSQGSNLLMELLLQRFENDPGLRDRLMSALVIGSLGRLERPEGALVPDSFENIPLCTHAAQTACIIAYDAIAAGGYEEREAVTRPCVNPSLLGGNPGIMEWALAGEYNRLPIPDSVETPWLANVGFITAKCDPDGFLAIDVVANDDREQDLPIETLQTILGGTLHGAEYNYAMGDLLRIVSAQAENMP